MFAHYIGETDYDCGGDTAASRSSDSNFEEEALRLFNNPSGLPDGGAIYGLVLNSKGVAIFGWGTSQERSTSALLENVEIFGIKLATNEFFAYEASDSPPFSTQSGPHADVIDMKAICDEMADYARQIRNNPVPLGQEDWPAVESCEYRGNVFSDAQLAMAELGEETPQERGRTRITESFLEWAINGEALSGGKLRCNGDVMGHTNKGIVGIRADNVDGLTIRNVVIRDIENRSPLGNLICGEYFVADATTQNGVRGTLLGYGATGVRGISLVASTGVELAGNIEIRNLASHYGSAVGLASHFGTASTLSGRLRVNRVLANTRLSQRELSYLQANPQPNALPKACGIDVEDTSTVAITGSVRTDNIVGASGC
jgi:hypothetical protein